MKILYTLNSGNYGGMEKHVLDLCEGMIKKGHQVHVWSAPGPLENEFKKLGVKLTARSVILDLDPPYILSQRNYLLENQIDLIHAHELKAVVNSLVAATLARKKIKISHTHTPISEWQINPAKKKIDLMIYHRAINFLSTYEIALTESRKRIKIKEGIKEEKLKVMPVPNAVKLANFTYEENQRREFRNEILQRHNLPESAKIIGCLGRLSEEKGQDLLVEAFSKYLEKLSRDKAEENYLMIVGGGPLENSLRKKSKKLGLEKKVIITGRFSEHDKKKYYAAFDLFVHPSLAEGFGIVLIEAMAAKVPVIASNLEVFKEVSQDTVSYFKKGDAQDLAEKIYQLQQTNQISSKVDEAYQRVVQNYTFEKFIETYEKFYLELLSKLPNK